MFTWPRNAILIQLNTLTKTATTTLTIIILIYVALLKDGLLKLKSTSQDKIEKKPKETFRRR